MIRARWGDAVLAEAERTVMVEGNHYFPHEALNRKHFTDSSTWTLCPWKGIARYYDVTVDGQTYPAAAWYYPKPSPLARRIKNHVAFWGGVEIERVDTGHAAAAPASPNRGWLRSLLGGTSA